MCVPLAFSVELLTTLVALMHVNSWKVDSLHMNQRSGPALADLTTQCTLEPSNVLSLSEFAGEPVQVLCNFSMFPSVILILHLQCSQVLHELRSNEFHALFLFSGTEAKHHKNCKCCPRHSLFKGHNVKVNIVVLNCQKCIQRLKCQVSGHKSQGLLFEGVLHMSLSLSFCWSGHVFSSHHRSDFMSLRVTSLSECSMVVFFFQQCVVLVVSQ